jgi:hypothetical protein
MSPDFYLYDAVRPKRGILARALEAIRTPNTKYRFRSYLQACHAIPAHSPVCGTTRWSPINHRRIALIDRKYSPESPLTADEHRELAVLKKIAERRNAPKIIAGTFLAKRYHRRVERINAELLKSDPTTPRLIKDWAELAAVPESETHRLEIKVEHCNGWIHRKEAPDDEMPSYLSTHTFYGTNYAYSTERLQACGFNVQLANWDTWIP